MICIDDFCSGGTASLKLVNVHGSSETRGYTAEYTARPTALTMAVASKAVIDALYHWTFHFCIKKKFKQPFLNKSESE